MANKSSSISQHLPGLPIIHRHFQFTPEMHKLWPSHDCGLSETLGLLALLAQQIKELVLSTVLVPNSIIPPSKHLTCETWQYQKTNRKSTLFICESLDDVPSASRLSATQWTEEYKECVKIWDKRKHQKPMVTSYNGWKWKLWNWLKLIETACSKCSSKSMVSLGIIFPSAPTLLTTHGVRTAIIRRTHTATSTFSLTKPL